MSKVAIFSLGGVGRTCSNLSPRPAAAMPAPKFSE